MDHKGGDKEDIAVRNNLIINACVLRGVVLLVFQDLRRAARRKPGRLTTKRHTEIMEKITLNRKELYEKVWSVPIEELCQQYDIDENGLEQICKRLNVPVPETTHWKRIAAGKKTNTLPLPEKAKGVDSLVLCKRDDARLQHEQVECIKGILSQIDPSRTLPDYSFDKLVFSTREGIVKDDWRELDKYYEKSKLLAVHVSGEVLSRALRIIDMLIKVLRFKGHDLVVERHQTFVVIDGEKIQVSIGEKTKRVEYIDEHNRAAKEHHPSGVLYLRKEGSSYSAKEWREGPRNGPLEDRLILIVNDLVEIARQAKQEREESNRRYEAQAEKDRIERERREKQTKELARFRGLLLDAHRYSLATMLRDYINALEAKGIAANALSDEKKEWIEWAKLKADWYDPAMPAMEDDLLNDVDVENLRTGNSYYSGFNYSGYGYEQKENNFWKPWWSK